MKETQIIFSTPMVKAILEGRKSQTRRVIKIKPGDYFNTHKIEVGECTDINDKPYFGFHSEQDDYKCPYGQKGDLLWVRETWASLGFWDKGVPVHEIDGENIIYKEEIPNFEWQDEDGFPAERKDGSSASHWKSPILMPKKFARIWLEIVNVKVKKLQDITYREVIAEGLAWLLTDEQQTDGAHKAEGIVAFAKLWDSINGKKHPWSSNPWVWVVEFKQFLPDSAPISNS